MNKAEHFYRLYKYLLYLCFFVILTISVIALWSSKVSADGESPSRFRNSVDTYKFEVVLNSVNEEISPSSCKDLALDKIMLFETKLSSLEKLVIHNDTNLRRGLANSSKVYLRCLSDKQEFINVLVHEVGHVVDTGFLQGSDGSFDSPFHDFGKPVKFDDPSYSFYSISWLDNENWRASTTSYSFVSGYASTDPFEDFAETFMMYVLYPELFLEMASDNLQLTRKYLFMKNEVFDGVEFLSNQEAVLSSYGLDLNKIRLYDATQIHKFIAVNL